MIFQTEFITCPLCKSKNVLPYGIADCTEHALWHEPLPKTLEWMVCKLCNHIYTRYYWTDAGLKELFQQAHNHQVATNDSPDNRTQIWKPVVANVINLLGGFSGLFQTKKTIPWLDVGCGDGSLVMTATEYGFTAVGLDARAQTVQELVAMGYNAFEGDFLTISVKDKIKVISMMDVLEHIPYPIEALQRARSLLEDDGILIISLPNMSSASWRIMDNLKANPYWIEIEHYHNFTREKLINLLNEHGFEVVFFDIPYRYKAQMELYAKKKKSSYQLNDLKNDYKMTYSTRL